MGESNIDKFLWRRVVIFHGRLNAAGILWQRQGGKYAVIIFVHGEDEKCRDCYMDLEFTKEQIVDSWIGSAGELRLKIE